MIENEEVQSGLYADFTEAPQNIPVNGSYFDCPICFVFDNAKLEEEEKDEENS